MPYADIEKKRQVERDRYRRQRQNHEWYLKNKARKAADDRSRRLADPDYDWKRHIRYYHGISFEELDRLLKEQGGSCAICGKNRAKKKRLVLDHCHRRHVIRGILCDLCNVLLSRANDNPEILKKAIAYLEKAKDSSMPWIPRRFAIKRLT